MVRPGYGLWLETAAIVRDDAAYSDTIIIHASWRECIAVSLKGHRRAFAFFGGLPPCITYDDSKIAVDSFAGSRE